MQGIDISDSVKLLQVAEWLDWYSARGTIYEEVTALLALVARQEARELEKGRT